MGWQVTATTIDCDFVGDFAVLMVYENGEAKCNFYSRYSKAKDGAKKLKNCKGPDCPKLAEFKEIVFTM